MNRRPQSCGRSDYVHGLDSKMTFSLVGTRQAHQFSLKSVEVVDPSLKTGESWVLKIQQMDVRST